MPNGLNRTDLNTTGITYKDGFPVTWPTPDPTHFGNPVDWATPDPAHFGNPIPSDGKNVNTVDWQTPDPAHFGNTVTPPTPSVPTGLAATSQDDPGNITLTWNASTGSPTGYKVYRSTSPSSGYTLLSSPVGTSYVDSTPVTGTIYYYEVAATGTGGDSANSASANAVSLAAPAGVSATGVFGAINLSWSAVTSATGYSVYRGTSSGMESLYIGSTTSTSLSDTSATAGVEYFYNLIATYPTDATNAACSSARSSEVSATATGPGKVQFVVDTNLNTSTGTLFVSGTSAGNDIIVGVTTNADASTPQSVVSVADDVNLSYTHVANTFQETPSNGGTSICDLWYFHNGAGGDINITVTLGLNANITIAAYEVSGLDGTITDSGSELAVEPYSQSITGDADGDFFVSSSPSWNDEIQSVSSPWTLDARPDGGFASLISTGNQTVQWTHLFGGGGENQAANFATFKAA